MGLPAFVEGRYFDVLAANSLARSLSPNLQVGQNRLRAVFLDPAEKALYPDWEHATARLVAGFRESVGSDADDPGFDLPPWPARPLRSPTTRSQGTPTSLRPDSGTAPSDRLGGFAYPGQRRPVVVSSRFARQARTRTRAGR